MNKKLYSKITDALVDDGYIIINNALEANLAKELKKIAKSENKFVKAGISGANDLHIDNTRRRDKILWLDDDSGSQTEFLNFARGLKDFINKELYMGISYYESHFAIYEKGDFYETHLDSFKNFKNRIVTTVYYLNDSWKDSDGGELIIYDENDTFLTKVLPHGNTLIIFLSDRFPHEVLPAKKKRYSIAGWFRVDKN